MTRLPRRHHSVVLRHPVAEVAIIAAEELISAVSAQYDLYFASRDLGLKAREAPRPWGPWTLVREWREDNGTGWTIPGEVQQWFFWDVSPKWISGDGLSIVVVATGKQDSDSWNTLEATLTVK